MKVFKPKPAQLELTPKTFPSCRIAKKSEILRGDFRIWWKVIAKLITAFNNYFFLQCIKCEWKSSYSDPKPKPVQIVWSRDTAPVQKHAITITVVQHDFLFLFH